MRVMTGLSFGKNEIPKESDEFKKAISMPSSSNDEELARIKESMPPLIYHNICKAFKKLWGYKNPLAQVPNSDIDGVMVLTEKNFTQNIKYVVDDDCPFLGKLFYIFMSDGLD